MIHAPDLSDSYMVFESLSHYYCSEQTVLRCANEKLLTRSLGLVSAPNVKSFNIKNFRFLLHQNVQMTTFFLFLKTWSPPVFRLTLWGTEWYILNICHAFNKYQLQARQVLFVDSMQSGFLKIIRICFSRLGRSRWVGNLMDLLTKDTKGPQGWSKIQAHLSIVQGHLLFPDTKVDQRHKQTLCLKTLQNRS